ncbi:MAG: hypothetical protein AAB588_05880 [Patescibacteria group bacterium]
MLSEEPRSPSPEIPNPIIQCQIHTSGIKVWTDCDAMRAAASVGATYRLSNRPDGGQKLILTPVHGRYDESKLATLLSNIQSDDSMVEISF